MVKWNKQIRAKFRRMIVNFYITFATSTLNVSSTFNSWRAEKIGLV